MNPPRIIHNQKNVTRHLNVLEQLTSQGISEYTFEDAVFSTRGRKFADNGRIGVAEAHKNIVRKYYDSKEITIFEDDIVFTSPESWDMYWKWYEELPEDWGVYTGGCYRFTDKRDVSDNLQLIRGFGGAHHYTIKKKYYDKMLECPDEKHIDIWIGQTIPVFAPKLLVSRQAEREFEGKAAISERKGCIVNYPNWRRKHKYL